MKIFNFISNEQNNVLFVIYYIIKIFFKLFVLIISIKIQ